MKERESFLARWSRRKRQAAESRANPVSEARPAVAEENQPKDQPADRAPRAGLEPSLPPIDSIDSGTDIRAFLQEGVPAGLRRAALRRAWRTDPAIRDFIGLSENSWDFNAPEGVSGFGAIPLDAARQAVAQVLGTDRPDSGREEPAGDRASDRPRHEVVKASEEKKTEAESVEVLASAAQPSGEHAATQKQETETGRPSPVSRSKGRALPK